MDPGDLGSNFRRGGLATTTPSGGRDRHPITVWYGLCLLGEGFIDYLTRETLRMAGKKVGYLGYRRELGIIDRLIAKVGPEPFFQATFTKRGFRTLFKAIDGAYGKGAFLQIAERMGEDWSDYRFERGFPPYKRALSFLQGK